MVDVENGKAKIAYLKRYRVELLVSILVQPQLVCVQVCMWIIHTEQAWQETHKWVYVKLKEKACRCDVVVDKWIWVEGLSVDKKSGVIS